MSVLEFKLKHASDQYAHCTKGDLYLSGVFLHKVVISLLDMGEDPYAYLQTTPEQVRSFYIASLNVAVSQIGKEDASDTIRLVQEALQKGEVGFSDLEISAGAFQEEVAFQEQQTALYKRYLQSDCAFHYMTKAEAIAYLSDHVDELISSDLDYLDFIHWISLYKKYFFQEEPITPLDLGMTTEDFDDLRTSAARRVVRELLANCRRGDEGRYGFEDDGFSYESLRTLLLDEQLKLSDVGTSRDELTMFRHPAHEFYVEDAREDLEACRRKEGSLVTGMTIVVAIEQIGVTPEEIGLTVDELHGFRKELLRDFLD